MKLELVSNRRTRVTSISLIVEKYHSLKGNPIVCSFELSTMEKNTFFV